MARRLGTLSVYDDIMYCMAVYNHYIQRDIELGGFYDQILECLDESVRRSLHQRRIRGTCHIYAERSHARHGRSDVVAERTRDVEVRLDGARVRRKMS